MRLNKIIKKIAVVFTLVTIVFSINAQETIKGKINDGLLNDVLIGANVTIKGTSIGTITEVDGTFELKTTQEFPLNLEISYLGYETQDVPVSSAGQYIDVTLTEGSVTIIEVEVKASRISEDNKKTALTVESLDVLAIKETASSNFYEGLGTLKNVDLTTASLGFQVINTRGFNSTSPVRSLQIIDGVDNQAPGLNFSLGNFLGSSELDVLKVDLIVGASSAFYGPNAFNGVIKMDTKNPFFHKGLSASVKHGERAMLETAVRWADSYSNSEGFPWMAYKLNASYLRADDWEAVNYEPITESDVPANNPGGIDAVNEYGDEYQSVFDHSGVSYHDALAGLGTYHRRGYREDQLVNYDTRNLKTNAALHFRLDPKAEYNSPELIISGSFSNGSTVYQGDNRFSLKNIKFLQLRTELMKKDKYFVRAYTTNENAGDSFDPYFTALLLQQKSQSNIEYNTRYTNYWTQNVKPLMIEMGYPELEIIFPPGGIPFGSIDTNSVLNFVNNNQDFFNAQHQLARAATESPMGQNIGFLEPGSPEFEAEFNRIISTNSGAPEGGTKLVDRSSLYHLHGEYQFNPEMLNFLKVGANSRLYTPVSDSTLFSQDENSEEFTNFEYGVYAGAEKGFNDDKITVSTTMRMDKNQNFGYLLSPAASVVYQPDDLNYLRFSFSSAIRNPTLTDQYLNFNVGRAILSGNINGVEDIITLESFDDFRNSQNLDRTILDSFNIAAIKPEKVKTLEVGYRTTLFGNTYLDAGYYYSFYNDFIGYNIGLDVAFQNATSNIPTDVQAYRYSANSINTVTTQGFSIGLNHYFQEYFKVAGNYSWNKLNIDDKISDDPIIPAFNTPEHKYNLSFGARKLPAIGNNTYGFNINYKWIQGFTFEGSPQFTGFIPSYGLVDAQVSYTIPSKNMTIKVGSSNILNNKTIQTYGGPRVGRLAYVSFVYEWNKK